LVGKRVDLLSRLRRHDEAIAAGEAAWAAAQSLAQGRAAVRVLVGSSLAAALSQAGRHAEAETLLVDLLADAEVLHGGRGNRLAALYGTLEQVRRSQGRHRAAAEAASRVVALYEATLPDSVYLAYALKTLGLNQRLLGEHPAAIATFARATSMFHHAEGAASEEAQWCMINRSASEFAQAPTAARLAALVALGEAYLAGRTHAFDWVVRMLLAESAADLPDLVLARRWALDVQARMDAAADPNPGKRARLQALFLELDLRGSRPVEAGDREFADSLLQSGEGGITHARLRTALARREPSPLACDGARRAWMQVDPQGIAWAVVQRDVPDCR
jgi:hypothetical protein